MEAIFECDQAKSRSNKRKYGISFEGARPLWDDPRILEIPARTEDEPRYLIIGRIGDRHWSAVITYRNEITRIISVRCSRIEEIELYESEKIG